MFTAKITTLSFLLLLHCSHSLDTNDFYQHINPKPFGKQQVKLESPVPYPHWSDKANKQIDIVSSGVARLSGFAGSNTLDVLIYATKIPLEFTTINYEQIESPNELLQANIQRDFPNENLTVTHVTIATWVDTVFHPNMFSTFQMVFATDGNSTYLVLNIARIDHFKLLPYYPEVDLRYSYAEGSKFQRLNFLKKYTGTSTRTEHAPANAAENTNCGKAGRWCFKLTDSPLTPVNASAPKVTATPPVVPKGKSITNSSGIGVKGAFTFTTLSLGGTTLTDGKSNNELSIILTKKHADQRYTKMNASITAYIVNVYKTASRSNKVTTSILGYRAGSLIVDYSVNTDASSICNGSTGQDCLTKVKKKVEEQVGNQTEITSGELSGKIDPKKIEVGDFDECSTGTSCDYHAKCVDYPETLSFGCFCKEGYVGNGFPGNCRSQYAPIPYTSLVMYITIVVMILSLAFVGVVYYKAYQHDIEKNKLEQQRGNAHQRLSQEWYPRLPYNYGSTVYRRSFRPRY